MKNLDSTATCITHDYGSRLILQKYLTRDNAESDSISEILCLLNKKKKKKKKKGRKKRESKLRKILNENQRSNFRSEVAHPS